MDSEPPIPAAGTAGSRTRCRRTVRDAHPSRTSGRLRHRPLPCRWSIWSLRQCQSSGARYVMHVRSIHCSVIHHALNDTVPVAMSAPISRLESPAESTLTVYRQNTVRVDGNQLCYNPVIDSRKARRGPSIPGLKPVTPKERPCALTIRSYLCSRRSSWYRSRPPPAEVGSDEPSPTSDRCGPGTNCRARAGAHRDRGLVNGGLGADTGARRGRPAGYGPGRPQAADAGAARAARAADRQ